MASALWARDRYIQAHLTRFGRIPHGLPTAWPALLLHDPEIPPLDASHEIVGHGNVVPVADAPHVVRIAVPGSEVQAPAQIKIIQVAEMPHEIMGNGTVRITAQDIYLHPLDGRYRIRLVAPIVQQQARVMRIGRRADSLATADLCKTIGVCVPWNDDLLEALLGLAPEVRSSRGIDRFNGSIARLEPLPETFLASVAIAYVKLVVNLPGYHLGMIAIMHRHGVHHAPHMVMVRLIAGTVVPPGSKPLAQTVQINRIKYRCAGPSAIWAA